MQVVVDIGNTRVKWAVLEDARLQASSSVVHRGALETALGTFAAALPKKLSRVVVANVAGAEIGARLGAIVTSMGATVEFVATAAERLGVRCGYQQPARLGVDRWVAVLAAHHLAPEGACVISAGTAVTFDAVAGGQHLGGLILAGARLQAAALARETSDIGATGPVARVPKGLDVLGNSTDIGVGHGAMLALAAAMDRAVRVVTDALGRPPAVLLAGGDADVLRAWLETKVELRADLVLEGLALLAAEPVSKSSRPKGT